jgi:hypothetical protein
MTTDPTTGPPRFACWVPNVSGRLDPAAVPDPAAGLTVPGRVLVGAR